MSLIQILVDKATGQQNKGTSFVKSEFYGGKSFPDFTIDATITENHTFEAEPTENPVESGVTISDHIDLKPETYTLTGVISDTPLNLASSIQGAATAVGALAGQSIVGPLGNLAGVGAGAFASLIAGSKTNRMKNSFDHLRNLQVSRIPFTVITGLHQYDSMVITSLTMNRDGKSGRSFNFTATLKRIRIVTSQNYDIPNTFKSTVGAAKTQDLGKKSTEELTGDNKTLFLKAGNVLAGFLTGGG